jgi:hypothetical protein
LINPFVSYFYTTSSILSGVEPGKSRKRRQSHSELNTTRHLKKNPLNAVHLHHITKFTLITQEFSGNFFKIIDPIQISGSTVMARIPLCS